MALSTLAKTDLLGTLPRHMVTHCAAQFGLVTVDLPVLRRRDPVCAVATKAAMMDAGIAWLFAPEGIPLGWQGFFALALISANCVCVQC